MRVVAGHMTMLLLLIDWGREEEVYSKHVTHCTHCNRSTPTERGHNVTHCILYRITLLANIGDSASEVLCSYCVQRSIANSCIRLPHTGSNKMSGFPSVSEILLGLVGKYLKFIIKFYRIYCTILFCWTLMDKGFLAYLLCHCWILMSALIGALASIPLIAFGKPN